MEEFETDEYDCYAELITGEENPNHCFYGSPSGDCEDCEYWVSHKGYEIDKIKAEFKEKIKL